MDVHINNDYSTTRRSSQTLQCSQLVMIPANSAEIEYFSLLAAVTLVAIPFASVLVRYRAVYSPTHQTHSEVMLLGEQVPNHRHFVVS